MPESFGRYTLLKSLGLGGMASIHLAKLTGIGGFEKLLAIKKIFPHLNNSEDFIAMLIAEARIAVELSHPNISQIFELGEVNGQYFIAMEYIHGRDAYTLITRCRKGNRQVPLRLACYITRQVLSALGHAHAKRDRAGQAMHIVHRDVSPRNILISYEGTVKLIDFGVAKAATVDQHTQAGLIKGKLSYMSPEQARCEPLDNRSDLFAAGLVLYELIHLTRLFGGRSDICTLEQVRSCRLPPFRAINPSLPEEIERILVRALASDRTKRYQTAQEFDIDLQRFLLKLGTLPEASDLAAFMEATFKQEIAEEANELLHLVRSESGPERRTSSPAFNLAQAAEPLPDDLSLVLEDAPAPDEMHAIRMSAHATHVKGGHQFQTRLPAPNRPVPVLSRHERRIEAPPPPWEYAQRNRSSSVEALVSASGRPAPFLPGQQMGPTRRRPAGSAQVSPIIVATLVALAIAIAVLVSQVPA